MRMQQERRCVRAWFTSSWNSSVRNPYGDNSECLYIFVYFVVIYLQNGSTSDQSWWNVVRMRGKWSCTCPNVRGDGKTPNNHENTPKKTGCIYPNLSEFERWSRNDLIGHQSGRNFARMCRTWPPAFRNARGPPKREKILEIKGIYTYVYTYICMYIY